MIGFILVLLKVLVNSVHNYFVKTLAINPIIIVYYRAIVILTMALPWSIAADAPPFPQGKPLKFQGLLLLRGGLSLLHTLANVFAYQLMPLGDSQMIASLEPLFVCLLARLFLKEPFGPYEIVALLVMSTGVTCVIKPPFIFSSDEEVTRDSMFWTAAAVLLASKALYACVGVLLRYFRDQSAASLTTNRELTYIIGLFYVIGGLNLEINNPSLEEKLKVLALGVSSMMFNYLYILALKVDEAHKVSLANRCLGVIFAVLTDIILFQDFPDYIAWIGVVLVILAIIILGIKKHIQRRRLKTDKSQDS